VATVRREVSCAALQVEYPPRVLAQSRKSESVIASIWSVVSAVTPEPNNCISSQDIDDTKVVTITPVKKP
jgi:hypothetical protein